FRGMFAMALWDAKRRQLWLIRDRMGVKPLYYSIHHGRITFDSEIKALLEDEEQERGVNEEALYYYLSFNATPAPHTLFSGVQKLAPGTWLRINEDGHTHESRYWDVWDHTEPLRTISETEIASASSQSCELALGSARSVMSQWEYSSPAASTPAPTQRCFPKAMDIRSRPSRSAMTNNTRATRASFLMPA